MILSGLSAITASLLYLVAINLLLRRIRFNQAELYHSLLIKIVTVAAIFHLASLAPQIFTLSGVNFNLALSVSFISWGAVVALLITNLNKNTGILGIFIYPIAALSPLLPIGYPSEDYLTYEIGTHILLSISAYSVLGLAAAQAILYSQQEKRFQKRQLSILFKALPPLQVMEKTLVQLTLIGFFLLSLALISGGFYIEDIFAQHLIHKTFFSIIAWFIYATFLFGHFQRGWRGQKAAHFILWAYILLLISYMGTESILLLLKTNLT